MFTNVVVVYVVCIGDITAVSHNVAMLRGYYSQQNYLIPKAVSV